MADTAVAITAGTGTNIDTRTEGTNGNHRQVVVIGDPATNAGVAPVDATKGLAVDLTASGSNTNAIKVNVASGGIASGAIASGAVASGAFAAGSLADGASVTIGTKADAASTATDTTAASGISIWKQISKTLQAVAGAASTALFSKITDGTSTVAVKAASTAPVATDPALVVALSPNGLNANGQTTMSASAPMTIASDQTIINKAVTQSSGITDSRLNAAASTNATSLKASAGNIFSIDVLNIAAYDVFLKLYNKASAPTVGTDTPVWTIPLKTGTGFSRDFPRGRNFATGIAYAITKLQADSDTTAVAAGDVTGTIGWI